MSETEKGYTPVPVWELPMRTEDVLWDRFQIRYKEEANPHQLKAADGIATGNRFLLVSVALERVNDIRTALAIGEGLLPELPKAIKGNSKHCVLARALSNGWTADVGGTGSIELRNDSLIEEQLTKALEQMRELGFDTQLYSQTLHIESTPLFGKLVDLFDNDWLPELILVDEELDAYVSDNPDARDDTPHEPSEY